MRTLRKRLTELALMLLPTFVVLVFVFYVTVLLLRVNPTPEPPWAFAPEDRVVLWDGRLALVTSRSTSSDGRPAYYVRVAGGGAAVFVYEFEIEEKKR